jgi:hypothetical protein
MLLNKKEVESWVNFYRSSLKLEVTPILGPPPVYLFDPTWDEAPDTIVLGYKANNLTEDCIYYKFSFNSKYRSLGNIEVLL